MVFILDLRDELHTIGFYWVHYIFQIYLLVLESDNLILLLLFLKEENMDFEQKNLL